MLIIPVQPIASQIVNVQLAGQPTTLAIYEKTTGLFMDVYVNDVLIIGGVACLNATKIIRTLYLGFIGDLAFFDNQPSATDGPSDPDYTGLGGRWPLYYLAPDEANDT